VELAAAAAFLGLLEIFNKLQSLEPAAMQMPDSL